VRDDTITAALLGTFEWRRSLSTWLEQNGGKVKHDPTLDTVVGLYAVLQRLERLDEQTPPPSTSSLGIKEILR
jgi:hypothetical protein